MELFKAYIKSFSFINEWFLEVHCLDLGLR